MEPACADHKYLQREDPVIKTAEDHYTHRRSSVTTPGVNYDNVDIVTQSRRPHAAGSNPSDSTVFFSAETARSHSLGCTA